LLAEPWTAAGPELVINATSASLAEQQLAIHPSVLSRARAAVDMMYGPAPTVFMQQAQQAGAARVADGLGMLVEQAAEAFFLWRGVRPETASVLAELRLQLAPPS
jgi:shikimate dehydrogenase